MQSIRKLMCSQPDASTGTYRTSPNRDQMFAIVVPRRTTGMPTAPKRVNRHCKRLLCVQFSSRRCRLRSITPVQAQARRSWHRHRRHAVADGAARPRLVRDLRPACGLAGRARGDDRRVSARPLQQNHRAWSRHGWKRNVRPEQDPGQADMRDGLMTVGSDHKRLLPVAG